MLLQVRATVSLHNLAVQFLLRCSQRRVEYVLTLLREVCLNIRLDATQQKRFQNLMESNHKLAFPLFDQCFLVTSVVHYARKVKHGLEVLNVAKDLWHQVIEEGPKFRDVVLQRRSRDKETVSVVILLQLFDKPTILVLHTVSFVLQHISRKFTSSKGNSL